MDIFCLKKNKNGLKLDDVVRELSNVDVPASGLALIILSETRDSLCGCQVRSESLEWARVPSAEHQPGLRSSDHNIEYNTKPTLNLLSQLRIPVTASTSTQ